MKLLFEGQVLDIVKSDNGIVFPYVIEQVGNQTRVAFMMYQNENGKTTNVAKHIYLMSKFGPDHKAFCLQTENYVSSKVVVFPGEQMLIAEENGDIKILDTDAGYLYFGKLFYAGEIPSAIALHEDKIWCAFCEKNVLVRYNVNTMREELRIGGGESSPFKSPCDIFIEYDNAYISNKESNSIVKLNLTNYSLNTYKELPIAPKKFLKVGRNEFVLSENGVYVIN